MAQKEAAHAKMEARQAAAIKAEGATRSPTTATKKKESMTMSTEQRGAAHTKMEAQQAVAMKAEGATKSPTTATKKEGMTISRT